MCDLCCKCVISKVRFRGRKELFFVCALRLPVLLAPRSVGFLFSVCYHYLPLNEVALVLIDMNKFSFPQPHKLKY